MTPQNTPKTAAPVSRIQAQALPALTGIRGVAAVWVVLFHLQSLWDLHLPLINGGFRAVDLFFVLSGFIMMHAHQADFLSMDTRRTLRFFGLRALRVYPLNTVVLLMILPVVLACPAFVAWTRAQSVVLGNAYSFQGFWQTLLLSNRWLMRDLGEWNGPTWSLSVELLAYLSFPMIALMLNKENSRVRCAVYALGAVAALVVFQTVTGRMDSNAFGRLGLLRALACFPAGVAAYRFCFLSQHKDRDARISSRIAAGSCLVLLACLLIPHVGVVAPLCFTVLIGCLYFQRGSVDRFLSSRICRFLGEISFPLYLLHEMPLTVLHWLLDTGRMARGTIAVLSACTLLILVVFASVLLNRFVEKPSHRFGRRRLDRLMMRP